MACVVEIGMPIRVATRTVSAAPMATAVSTEASSSSAGIRPLPEKARTRLAARTTDASAPAAVDSVASQTEPP